MTNQRIWGGFIGTAGLLGLPVALDVAKACPLSGNGITDEQILARCAEVGIQFT